MRHRRDDSDCSRRARKTEIPRWSIAAGRSIRRCKLGNLFERRQDFIRGHDVFPRELAHIANGHELDKPDVPWMIESESSEVANLVVVDSAHHDDVQLD